MPRAGIGRPLNHARPRHDFSVSAGGTVNDAIQRCSRDGCSVELRERQHRPCDGGMTCRCMRREYRPNDQSPWKTTPLRCTGRRW